MKPILEMYVTILPVIVAGVLNMAFVKSSVLNDFKKPLDKGLLLKDGRRLFGDNKTWKGYWGMTVLTAITMVIWGALSTGSGILADNNLLYRDYDNTLLFNITAGLLLGFAYVASELPNSFMKRRLGIKAGETPAGSRGLVFGTIDQIDSAIGCVFVISLFWPMSLMYFIVYVCVVGVTHILFNVLLYSLGLKREI